MTTQDLRALRMSTEQLAALGKSLDQLEKQLAGLVAMSSAQRRKLIRMGHKSEAFCRQALQVLAQNAHIVPSSYDVNDAVADLKALDDLRPLLQRIGRLAERAADSDTALRSNVMRHALDGYAILKVSGHNQGLEGLRRRMGQRFNRSRKPPAAASTD